MLEFTATQLAELTGGSIEGDPTASVHTFGKIEEAKKGELSFLANPKYEEYLYTTNASIVLVNNDLELKEKVDATLVRVPNSYSAFAKLLEFYSNLHSASKIGIDEKAVIPASAKIGKDVYIAPYVVLGENVCIGDNTKIYPGCYLGDNVSVGDNCVLNANISIYHDCKVGNHVILHAGIVIGADGFGFAPNPDGTYSKIPQIGNVVIEDNVEVGANTTIDRATIGSTHIEKGVKLDNLVQIAHNVVVGENTVIAAQAGVSGSTKLGKHVMMGGQSGIVGHLHIGDCTRINAQSGVTKSVKEANTAINGTPAADYRSTLKSQALFRELPQMEARIKELEKTIKELTSK